MLAKANKRKTKGENKMKKKTESVNNKNIEKTKRTRRHNTFFLYVEGNGFIHLDKEVGAIPSYDKGELLTFPSKSAANYAREFFVNMQFAENIDIVAKIA